MATEKPKGRKLKRFGFTRMEGEVITEKPKETVKAKDAEVTIRPFVRGDFQTVIMAINDLKELLIWTSAGSSATCKPERLGPIREKIDACKKSFQKLQHKLDAWVETGRGKPQKDS